MPKPLTMPNAVDDVVLIELPIIYYFTCKNIMFAHSVA